MSVTAMDHNFVLLPKDSSIFEFFKPALEAKDNDYFPTDKISIIAHTGLIGGGESDTNTFQAPEKGRDDFFCSFPDTTQ